MKWMRFCVRTRVEAEDILISAMEEIGLCGAEIEDHVPLTAAEKEQMFIDILPPEEENDGSAVVSFFLEEAAAQPDRENDGVRLLVDGQERTPEEVLRSIRAVIEELRQYSDVIGEGTVTIEETEDLDWVNNWKQYFHQFWIDDILVIPSWESPQPEEKEPALIFHMDPGTAFGTGAHETTQLCIRQIRKHMTRGAFLLDVGTGSGILSILSLLFGAREAVCTDLDPCVESAVMDNLRANGVDPSRLHLILGNLVDDSAVQDEVGFGRYDIVVANILPNVLIPLAPAAARALAPGGCFITSGILEGLEGTVADAMRAAGLTVTDITAQGEWRCVTAVK